MNNVCDLSEYREIVTGEKLMQQCHYVEQSLNAGIMAEDEAIRILSDVISRLSFSELSFAAGSMKSIIHVFRFTEEK